MVDVGLVATTYSRPLTLGVGQAVVTIKGDGLRFVLFASPLPFLLLLLPAHALLPCSSQSLPLFLFLLFPLFCRSFAVAFLS